MTNFNIKDLESFNEDMAQELILRAIKKADYYADLHFSETKLTINSEYEVKLPQVDAPQEDLDGNQLISLGIISELIGLFQIPPSYLENFKEAEPVELDDIYLSINEDKLKEVDN